MRFPPVAALLAAAKSGDSHAARTVEDLLCARPEALDDDELTAIDELPLLIEDPAKLYARGNSLVRAYDETGRYGLLAPARRRLEAAVIGMSESDEDYADTAMLLGNVLRALAGPDEQEELYGEAVEYQRKAADLASDDAESWSALATTLKEWYDIAGGGDRLHEARRCKRRAVDLLDPQDPRRPDYCCDLGAILFACYREFSNVRYLEQAREFATYAVDGALPDSLYARMFRVNLAVVSTELAEIRSDAGLAAEAMDSLVLICDPPEQASATEAAVLHNARVTYSLLTGTIDELDRTIEFSEAVLNVGGVAPEMHTEARIRSASAWRHRFGNTGDVDDLEMAVSHVKVLLEDPGVEIEALDIAAVVYALRFAETEEAADLDRALDAARRSVDEAGATAERALNLANILHSVFDSRNDHAALDEAIELLESAESDCVPTSLPRILSSLGSFLVDRYDAAHRIEDLTWAARVLEQAREAVPREHPDHSAILANLANMRMSAFETDGTAYDLDVAIETLCDAQAALPQESPDRAAVLANLGLGLRLRFDLTGDRPDLEAAITAGELALVRASSPRRIAHASNLLAAAWHSRFAATGDMSDLHLARRAIAHSLSAVGTTDLAQRANILINRVGVELSWFETSGAAAALDTAVGSGRRALSRAGTGNAATAATMLSNALLTRYELRGSRNDLEDAVVAARTAVTASPVRSPFRPGRLSNLGNTLLAAAAHTAGDKGALDEAIRVGREAVATALPLDPDLPGYWSNLGLAYSDRFEAGHDLDDLGESVTALTEAVDGCPADHPSKPLYVGNLAMALRQRYVATGNRADVKRAIALLEETVRRAVSEHPHTGSLCLALGNALHSAFLLDGDPDDYRKALQAWRRVGESRAAASIRLIAAESLAQAAADEKDRLEALEGYRQAIDLVPVVAWHGLDRKGREEALSRLGPLAGAAAAAALEADDPRAAVELLEGGRSILWKQALDLRHDFTALQSLEPDLARRLREVARLLR